MSYHLKKLKDLELVIVSNFGNKVPLDENTKVFVRKKRKGESLYQLKNRETYYTIYDLLIICKDGSSDKEFLNCILLTDEAKLHFKKRVPRVLNIKGPIPTPKQEIDNAVKIFFEICPNPYCIR